MPAQLRRALSGVPPERPTSPGYTAAEAKSGGAGICCPDMSELHDPRHLEQGVMVDVGPGAGALVIYTEDDLNGDEIEISDRDGDSRRVHTDVLRRKVAGGYVSAAVFGSLAEGEYLVWHKRLSGPTSVKIVSGQVTELDWR